MAARIATLFSLMIGLAAPTAAEPRAPRVGLVVTTRVNVTEGEADTIAGRLADALREQLEVDVVAGAEARRRLPAKGVEVDCVARKKCVAQLADRLDSDQLLFLVVVKIGLSWQIDSTWADPKSGEAVSRPAIKVELDGARAARAFDEVGKKLLPDARPRRPPPAPEPVAAPPPQRVVIWARPRPAGERRVATPVKVAGAVSLTALAGGLGFAIWTRSDYKAIEADGCAQMRCPEIDARVDRMETKALVADLLFGTSVAAGLTALLLHVTDRPVQVAPTAERGAVVSFGGRF